MIRNVENAILVTRILADNGLGGRQLERAATAIIALGEVEPGSTVREWCRLNLDSYREGDSIRKIMMIKDCRALFGLTLKAAKDFVDEAVTNADLARLRERLTGTGPIGNPDPFGYTE